MIGRSAQDTSRKAEEYQAGEEICYQPIGVVHSPFSDPGGMPIQSRGGEGVGGTVEIAPEYESGLRDIEGFSRIILIYHFHRSRGSALQVIPFLDTVPHGVFATRAPARPNPIGISVVRLDEKKGNILFIRDIDLLDGTPVLDIKPYIPSCDSFPHETTGWFPEGDSNLVNARSDGRFG
ncbi:MAG: tRNA (N6-threonylcarbamoyladenosine(37)-N6)-methyltransferase TrmO [Methanolinea sp.]|nr:tRNA (N6-threonylcarbamoyladenosine(37)-N6)-methyltransferase TrmO [Methanolinea sp.]